MKFPRKTAALAGAVVAIAALGVPSIGAAKTTKPFHVVCLGKSGATNTQGTVLTGKCSKSPTGKTTFKGVMLLPKLTLTVKLKGGTVTFSYNAAVDKNAKVTGKFKITKGTGKYKGAKGSGKIVGSVAGLTDATGKITY